MLQETFNFKLFCTVMVINLISLWYFFFGNLQIMKKKMINRTTSFSWSYTWDRRVQTIGPKSRRNRDLRPLQTSSLLVPMLWMKWICNTAIKVYEYHNFFLNQYLLPLKFIHDKLGLIFCNFIGKNHWSLSINNII